jgi:hypothetical protein
MLAAACICDGWTIGDGRLPTADLRTPVHDDRHRCSDRRGARTPNRPGRALDRTEKICVHPRASVVEFSSLCCANPHTRPSREGVRVGDRGGERHSTLDNGPAASFLRPLSCDDPRISAGALQGCSSIG